MAGDNHSIVAVVERYAHLFRAAARPLPTQTGDGSYIEEEAHSSSLLEDLSSFGVQDVKTLLGVLEAKVASRELTDDSTLFQERLVALTSKLPENSSIRRQLSNNFTQNLWASLNHPPKRLLGADLNYRRADGSYNNVQLPNIGKAGTPYAQSVAPNTVVPPSRPDPGLIFDSVLSRENGGFKPHPSKISSMLFYLATIIIHDCFRTSSTDKIVNNTSSYLDLAPLYGSNQGEQDLVRTYQDGLLKPDTFSETRILGMPPGVGTLLIMFNRFHNHVATHLAAINENGRSSKTVDETQRKAEVKKRDNDLFQTARLITCGLYVHIVLHDYVRTILNLNRTDSTWWIDPRADLGDGNPGMGDGNQCSMEFNIIYRWHACISQRDEKLTEALYDRLLGKSYRDASAVELMTASHEWAKTIPTDPQERTFGGLKRQADGSFSDDDLVEILCDGVEDLAGAFGANNVPLVMRAVEVLGIEQGRSWHAATLNELRKFFGLVPHKTFEDINPDPMVADRLKALYDHPDYVELYAGVNCEKTKPVMPGSGLVPGYTISRAILSDALALARGDRHHTLNYHPAILTNYGYHETESDPVVESGDVFYKLILRAFPHHFDFNSIYAHKPMVIPSANREIMRSLGREDAYTWRRPARQSAVPTVRTLHGARAVLENGGMRSLAGPGPRGLAYPDNWTAIVRAFFEKQTLALLRRWSSPVGGAESTTSQVDVIRDVANLAPVHFVARFWSMPLKTEQHPRGIFTDHELKDILTLLFADATSAETDPVKKVQQHVAAKPIREHFVQLMAGVIEATVRSSPVGNLKAWLLGHEADEISQAGVVAMRKLLDDEADSDGDGDGDYDDGGTRTSADLVSAALLPASTSIVAEIPALFGRVLDYYLAPGGGIDHLPDIRRLARLDTAEADAALARYALEAIRLNGSRFLFRHAREHGQISDGARKVKVKAGECIRVDLHDIRNDADIYPDAAEVRFDRPLDSYGVYGDAVREGSVTGLALTAMLKVVVGRLDGLRRAPGPQGVLKTVVDGSGAELYMDPTQSTTVLFPTTLKVFFDGPVV